MGSKHWTTDGRNMWTTRGTMLKNKHHLVTFHESIFLADPYIYIYIYIYIFLADHYIYTYIYIYTNFTLLTVLSTFIFELKVFYLCFFFWLGITLLVDYFQAVRMFLVFSFSFFMEFFFLDTSLCNISLFANCITGFFFHNTRIIE